MKISAINNTNFKGLYIDKSNENNGNWKMEYSPYSWEASNTSKPSAKERVNILASNLPDNEEIYETFGSYRNPYNHYIDGPEKEISRDILGTVSYYKHLPSDDKRAEVHTIGAMNREDSLKIYDSKLARFLDMKAKYETTLREAILGQKEKLESFEKDYAMYSRENSGSFILFKPTSKENMDTSANKIIAESKNLWNNAKNYITLRDSIEDLKNTRVQINDELNIIANARKQGTLIDISKRDIFDPNKVLWEALQDARNALNKIVMLPHKTISVQELIAKAHIEITDSNFSSKIIKLVDEMIKKMH